MKNLRRLSQILFLILFLILFIQTEYKGNDQLGLPVKLFLDFDPLIALSALLAAHTVRVIFLLSLITILLTVLLGRVFCGWICPLGTLNTFFSYFKMRSAGPKADGAPFAPLRRIKYFILIFILVAALLGWNSAGFLDPISLTIRSLALGYNPAANLMVRSAFEFIVSLGIPGLSSSLDSLYSSLTGVILAFEQPVFRQMIPIALIFTAILALNFLSPRFWCRYLCPLGALLGLLGTKQPLARVDVNDKKCIACRRCNQACQGEATPFPAGKWASRECLACFNCRDICPAAAVSIHPTREKTGRGNVDLQRRWLLACGLGAVVSVPLVKLGGGPQRQNPELIRPPGALGEDEFLRTCVKCGECMKVCLTNGLQPTFAQAGLEGFWTPLLVPRLGYCEYNCNLCSQVCPTGAIQKITLEEKQNIRIGLAMFDRNRCIPYALGRNCGVCEEHCPAPGKAIKFHEEEARDERGEKFTLKKPFVDPHLCIGCGICENKCPFVDIPAVRVTSINESRGEYKLYL
ncbi:MAG: 4Fe-4S dicluster domain-containing protein [Candidatus Krumholzibacteriota bacterium]|nr:4Fe-4S dicluster domain-containing protein [Candidatus Krumholzibacteriota bacterium]